MRCYCCDKVLSNSEAVARFKSGEFTEMCKECLSTITGDVDVIEKDVPEDDEEE